MKLELPGWAVAGGVLLLLAAAVAVPYAWMEKGAREAEAERWRDSSRVKSVRADSTAEEVAIVRDSLHELQDSLQAVSLELSKTRLELTGALATDIDTVRAVLPDSLQYIPARLEARLDSLQRVHRREEAVWKRRLAEKDEEIRRLEELYRAEHEARLAAERAREELNDALNPPFWTSVAGSLPEAGAKLGGGIIACSGELPLEACVTYVAALGIDAVSDL